MTTATRAPSGRAWADAFTEAANTDPELQAHGKYFTCSYLLDATERSYVIQVRPERSSASCRPGSARRALPVRHPGRRGHVARVRRAVPAPMYHGIWAASFQLDMRWRATSSSSCRTCAA
jgi:hypothetical protein